MVTKHEILNEIKRTATENGGLPLGRQRFSKITGIDTHNWWGVYWRAWGDALKEAGFNENKLQAAYDKDFLILSLAKLTKKLGRFPADADLRLARKEDVTFPSHSTFRKLGSRNKRLEQLKKLASEDAEFQDILLILPAPGQDRLVEMDTTAESLIRSGFVYLGLLNVDGKKRYKIGRTNLVERRGNELSVQLPEKIVFVHAIETDDANGIEAYWHQRFKKQNTNGEWFNLTVANVKAFKRRKFM